MASSFISTFFPGSSSVGTTSSSSRDKAPLAGDADAVPRPVTPTMNINSFINPLSTPLGSPSKKTNPPGAHDLPAAFDAAMNLNLGSNVSSNASSNVSSNLSSTSSGGFDAPVRLTPRPQNVIAPLSPSPSKANGSSNANNTNGSKRAAQLPPQPRTPQPRTPQPQPLTLQSLEKQQQQQQQEEEDEEPAVALPLDGSVVQKKMPKVEKIEKAEKAEKTEKAEKAHRVEKGRASPGSPRKRHAQPQAQAHDPNAPPVPRLAAPDQDRHPHHSHAALSRQQMYDTKGERPIIAKRFNTARGLTAEEREILQRPNVRRMVNVTQLCKFPITIIVVAAAVVVSCCIGCPFN